MPELMECFACGATRVTADHFTPNWACRFWRLQADESGISIVSRMTGNPVVRVAWANHNLDLIAWEHATAAERARVFQHQQRIVERMQDLADALSDAEAMSHS